MSDEKQPDDMLESLSQNSVTTVKRQITSNVEPKKKYSISKVEKEFTQLTKQERQDFMVEKVNEIFSTNQNYFKGREVLFENNSSYFQCISRPGCEN